MINRNYIIVILTLFVYTVQAQFVNRTIDADLDHSHHSTNTLGGGVLFFDANNDGWEDILMTGGNEDDALYINNTDGTFSDYSNNMAHNRGKNVQTSSCAAADLNRDGLTDLFFGTLNADEPNILLLNIGDNTFLNVSIPAGISHPAQTMGATFLDYNHDGWLDIYVMNYVREDRYERDGNNDIIGYNHDCFENFLYRNDGNMEFTEVSEQLGLNGDGCTLAATTLPHKGDPFALYVVHDFGEWVKPNEFLIYDQDSNRFKDIAQELGLDIGLYGMGVGVGDIDNDLDLDLYLSNIGHNYLMEKGGVVYKDISTELGVDNTFDIDNDLFSTSWSNFFWDFNNDELLDLYVVNGHIPVASFLENSRRDNNKLYQRTRQGYLDKSESSGLDYDYVNRGASVGDFNNDGFQDVVIATTRPGGAAILPELNYQLYKNDLRSGHFSQIKLQGSESNIEGYGSSIYLFSGSSKQLRYVYSGGVHASQNSTITHFGLSNRQFIDSIEVRWPSGTIDIVRNPPIDQRLLIVEGQNSYQVLGCKDPENRTYNSLATINTGCATTTVNTSDVTDEIDISVFPNPAKDYLNLNRSSQISEEVIRLEIYNVLGQMVTEIKSDPNKISTVDISQLSTGQYWIKGFLSSGKFFQISFSKNH